MAERKTGVGDMTRAQAKKWFRLSYPETRIESQRDYVFYVSADFECYAHHFGEYTFVNRYHKDFEKYRQDLIEVGVKL